ncbi:MAG: hypothetical protein AAF288_13045 [Planctomycetota bacterium]
MAGLALLVVLMAVSAWLGTGLDRWAQAFDHDRLLVLVGVMTAAGAVYVAASLGAVRWSRSAAAGRGLVWAIVLGGLLIRLPWFFGDPLLEDDHFRYLWDGQVTAIGEDPYALSPTEILAGLDPNATPEPPQGPLWDAARDAQARDTLGRINHPEVRTIYPPVAQLGFAVAQAITPYRVFGLRLLFLVCEVLTVWGLWVALRRLGRPTGWAAVYAWNPLLAWSLIGAAHMDALILPCLAWALASAARGGVIGASGLLAVAAGVKLWPAMLAPLLWRSFWKRPVSAGLGALVFCAVTIVLVVPPIAAIEKPTGGHDAGLLAYSSRWRFNDALFSVFYNHYLEEIGDTDKLQPKVKSASRQAAAVALFGVLGVAMLLPGSVSRDPDDSSAAKRNRQAGLAVSRRWLIATAALFMLSPTQLPWYAVWLAPMLVLTPSVGLMLYAGSLPLYYLWLHPAPPWGLGLETSPWVQNGVVWAVLLLEGLALGLWWAWRRAKAGKASKPPPNASS